MKIFPAIDLYEGKAVRLLKGDYEQMTIYSEQPLAVARDFEAAGADCLHLVDLEGARLGTTPNLTLVTRLAQETSLFTEIGGGIRSMETVKTYIAAGVDRVILGTAAVENETFLREAVAAYGEKIAVGVDIKDGFVAVKGWTETSASTCFVFCDKMKQIGVRTLRVMIWILWPRAAYRPSRTSGRCGRWTCTARSSDAPAISARST